MEAPCTVAGDTDLGVLTPDVYIDAAGEGFIDV